MLFNGIVGTTSSSNTANVANIKFQLLSVGGTGESLTYTEVETGKFNFAEGKYAIRIMPNSTYTLQEVSPGETYLQSATFTVGAPTSITTIANQASGQNTTPITTLLTSIFGNLSPTTTPSVE